MQTEEAEGAAVPWKSLETTKARLQETVSSRDNQRKKKFFVHYNNHLRALPHISRSLCTAERAPTVTSKRR